MFSSMSTLPGAAAAIFAADVRRLTVLGRFVEPIVDQRHFAAENLAQPRGDLVERAIGFSGSCGRCGRR